MTKASKLKLRRVAVGLKQKDVAEKAGITAAYLLQLEKGIAKNPNIELMKKLAEILGSTPQDLFFAD